MHKVYKHDEAQILLNLFVKQTVYVEVTVFILSIKNVYIMYI